MIKTSKETLKIQRQSLKKWQQQRQQDPIFTEHRQHMIISLKNHIKSNIEGIKDYNELINKWNK